MTNQILSSTFNCNIFLTKIKPHAPLKIRHLLYLVEYLSYFSEAITLSNTVHTPMTAVLCGNTVNI